MLVPASAISAGAPAVNGIPLINKPSLQNVADTLAWLESGGEY
jgi:hypothetical protein